MERRCAWCGRDLSEDGAPGGNAAAPDGEVTHGICPTCLDRVNSGSGVPISEFVAALDEPAILMDSDHTVGLLNEAARALLGDGPAPGDAQAGMMGERAGVIFRCENAHLPGGCGRTIHCSGCTIRQSVAHTYLTGEPKLNVPATLRVVDEPGLTDVDLVISTTRVGDRVLLKIDRWQR